jgi:hypothetical protein
MNCFLDLSSCSCDVNSNVVSIARLKYLKNEAACWLQIDRKTQSVNKKMQLLTGRK